MSFSILKRNGDIKFMKVGDMTYKCPLAGGGVFQQLSQFFDLLTVFPKDTQDGSKLVPYVSPTLWQRSPHFPGRRSLILLSFLLAQHKDSTFLFSVAYIPPMSHVLWSVGCHGEGIRIQCVGFFDNSHWPQNKSPSRIEGTFSYSYRDTVLLISQISLWPG
jgi:hypothetical protein